MALETSADSPAPVRTVLQLVGGWITRLGRIWVEGQIAELNARGGRGARGPVFLTLRDPIAAVSVRVICTRQVFDAAEPEPAEGARVVIHARPDFNANRGTFALSALEIRPVGLGELLARIERLRRSLAAEGLFAPERKRPLPFLPGMIGLVCGRDSAAERDVLHTAQYRWPAVRFRTEYAAVQGQRAVPEVTDALRRLDADPQVDVIIVTRGGGSIEDLLPFSDEEMVRTVAACRTPVISAIGHQQDTPLIDHVADVRASTPTDAARRATPDVSEQIALITGLRDRARRVVGGWLDREWGWLSGMRSRPALADPVREIERQAERVEALADRSRRSLSATLSRAGDDIGHTRARLRALSPKATLGRGYAIVQRPGAARAPVVRAASEVDEGESLLVRFAEDRLAVTAGRPVTADPADERDEAGEAGGATPGNP